MRKVFKFKAENKKEARVLEGIKNEIRKYVKREKKKELEDKGNMYWDFDCKVGESKEDAKEVIYEELLRAVEKVKQREVEECYVEILSKSVLKPEKGLKE